MAGGIGRFGSVFAFGALVLIGGVGAVVMQPDLIAPLLRTQPAAAATAAPSAPATVAQAATLPAQVAAATPAAPTAAAPVVSALPSGGVITPTSLSPVAGPRVIYGQGLQCAIYARQRTGVALSGAARLWWDQAADRYQRTHTPQAGAIMAMGGTSSGHVAVVARVISAREILLDHANWNNQGEIQLGALAVDVSEANDWSAVRVWHVPTNQLGLRPYPVMGFIIPGEV